MYSRRRLLRTSIALAATCKLNTLAQPSKSESVRLSVGKSNAKLSTNFIGLGYEKSSAARVGLLDARNEQYVQLVRNLGPNGTLRIGGIVADFSSYQADGLAKWEAKETVINRASLEQLRGFLDATDWSVIWSLNFGSGTLEEATVEVKDVARILGPRLFAIELGNEVENYGRGARPLRQPPYTYEMFRSEYIRWSKALLVVVPGLHFAAPDTAASVEWVERMAADARGDVQLLTTHYYRGDQRIATLEQLTKPDPDLKTRLVRLRSTASRSSIPWRMCETNSFFGGGRPGISDTFAASLWTLDYMCLLALYGSEGVNIETGVNQLGFLSSYSPIRDEASGHASAGASYYGMLAFAHATTGASTMFEVELDRNNDALSAYAFGDAGRLHSLLLISRSSEESIRVSLKGVPLTKSTVMRLASPELEGKTEITFGGATVDSSGFWKSSRTEVLNAPEIFVEANSAAVVRWV